MRSLKAFVAVLFLVALAAGAAAAAAEKTAGPGRGRRTGGGRLLGPPAEGRRPQGPGEGAGRPARDRPREGRQEEQDLPGHVRRRQTSPEEILRAVNTVSKEATLVAVTPADPKAAGGAGCGGCPQAKSPPGSKK